MLDEENYPNIIEYLEKYLYQLSAPSLEDAIKEFRNNDQQSIEMLLAEIRVILASDATESELNEFVTEHSDYLVDGDGRKTLELSYRLISG